MILGKEDLVHFSIDARASLFTVQAFAAGIAAVVAHSPKFAIRDVVGEIAFVPGALQNASLEFTSAVASLEIMDEVSAVERREIERVMFHEVLQKDIYPQVIYKSSHVNASRTAENMYRVHITGDLTLHGITRGIGMEAQIVTGEDTLRAQGAFSLLQSDFGLRIASVAQGTLKLKDELKFAYFMVGRRQN